MSQQECFKMLSKHSKLSPKSCFKLLRIDASKGERKLSEFKRIPHCLCFPFLSTEIFN